MSPLRIERVETFQSFTGGVRKSVRKTTILEADESFTIGPADASYILGTSRTTLFRHLRSSGLEEQLTRQPSPHAYGEASRVLTDSDILAVAKSLKENPPQIVKHGNTGLVELITPTSRAMLDLRRPRSKKK